MRDLIFSTSEELLSCEGGDEAGVVLDEEADPPVGVEAAEEDDMVGGCFFSAEDKVENSFRFPFCPS
jgi:hypothetical protein